jgi:hypothetical protein
MGRRHQGRCLCAQVDTCAKRRGIAHGVRADGVPRRTPRRWRGWSTGRSRGRRSRAKRRCPQRFRVNVDVSSSEKLRNGVDHRDVRHVRQRPRVLPRQHSPHRSHLRRVRLERQEPQSSPTGVDRNHAIRLLTSISRAELPTSRQERKHGGGSGASEAREEYTTW